MGLTGESSPVDVSVESLVANLPELLGAMVGGADRVVAIAEFADHRYVQFLGGEGRLVAEVISNLKTAARARRSAPTRRTACARRAGASPHRGRRRTGTSGAPTTRRCRRSWP